MKTFNSWAKEKRWRIEMFSCEKFLKREKDFSLPALVRPFTSWKLCVRGALLWGDSELFLVESRVCSQTKVLKPLDASAWSNFECYLCLVHFSSVSSSMFPAMKKKVLWFYPFRPKLYNITTTAARTFSPASYVWVLFMCNCILKYYYVQLHRVCQTETDFHFE